MTAVHAVPIGDHVAHHVPGRDPDGEMPGRRWAALAAAPDDGQECVCGPEVQRMTNSSSGRDWWRYLHHALDGREQDEEAADGAS